MKIRCDVKKERGEISPIVLHVWRPLDVPVAARRESVTSSLVLVASRTSLCQPFPLSPLRRQLEMKRIRRIARSGRKAGLTVPGHHLGTFSVATCRVDWVEERWTCCSYSKKEDPETGRPWMMTVVLVEFAEEVE
jgi:hypothetical protein